MISTFGIQFKGWYAVRTRALHHISRLNSSSQVTFSEKCEVRFLKKRFPISASLPITDSLGRASSLQNNKR